jgi:hypothetical protein
MQFNVVTADGLETWYSRDYRLDESTGVLYIHERYTDEYGEARRTLHLSPTFWQQPGSNVCAAVCTAYPTPP